MPERPPADYRQHLEVETPEHVVLDYEIAGVGSRTLAAAADWFIITLLALAATLALGLWKDGGSTWLAAVLVLVLYSIVWGYFTCFEGLRQGQTPGKRAMGIRVIRDTGHPVSFSDAAARNLLLPLDLFGMLGIFLIAIHPRAKRLGDMVAGTVVVRDHPVQTRAAPAASAATPEPDQAQGAPELSDEEFRLLREFVGRAQALPTEVRSRLARGIVTRLAERYPERPASDLQFLDQLHTDELARRRGRFGARSGGPGRRAGGGVVERLVARKSTRWDEFQRMAERVSKQGLDVLSADELPDFARRYREVAADLARVRTYGADASVQARLGRLVATGHGALYRQERHTWARMWSFIARECPAAIVESRRYVFLAFLTFILPAAGGFALLRQRPELAPELLPDVMLERAEAGATRSAQGAGYVETGVGQRPIVASSIIANNIRVAFSCFAGGIVFGVGSLVLLAFNGLSLGAASGHFANVGLLGYLWTFVVGHGVLELFAIWVSGAAGFMLGRALIAPGDLPRRDAIVLAGRTAMRLVGAAIVFLLMAGLIEGFVSSGDFPLPIRLAVSSFSGLFLILYLYNGWRTAGARLGA
ncbi:MAG TPA: stage II sporulation protein M [Gemmatimonadales bacterium]|nr:stage II sporulation protein M [Gemmatimonadales bacterium]